MINEDYLSDNENSLDYDEDFYKEEDEDIIEQCLCEVEENWDISEANEDKMADFLRENNYDVDILIDELQTGVFGPFSPKYEYEIEITKDGKPKLNKFRSLQPNYQKGKNKQPKVKQQIQKDPLVENPKIVRTLFTGPKSSGKTTISRLLSLGSNPFDTIQHRILYEEGETMEQFQHSELIIIVTSINNSQEEEEKYFAMAQACEASYVIVVVNKLDELPKYYQEDAFTKKKKEIQKRFYKNYDNFLGIIPASAKEGIGIRTLNYPFYNLNPLKLMIELVDKKPIVIEDDFYMAADDVITIENGITKVSGYVYGGFKRLAEEVIILPNRIEGKIIKIEPQKKCVTKWSYTTLTIQTKENIDQVIQNGFIGVSNIQFPNGRLIKFKPIGYIKPFTDNCEFVAEFAHCSIGGTFVQNAKGEKNVMIAILHEKICVVPHYSSFVLHTKDSSVICQIIDATDKGFLIA